MTFHDHPDDALRFTHRSILLDPDDDAPRLIFADRLEELAELTGDVVGRVSNGYAERAEFIRVQVELERHEHGRQVRDGDYDARDGIGGSWVRAFELYERELALFPIISLRNFCVVGLPSMAIIGNVARGFVHSIRLTQAEFLQHAETLFREHPIQRVELGDREPSEWARESGESTWVWTRHEDNLIRIPGDLNIAIFRLLPTESVVRCNSWHLQYRTQQSAIDAVSDACVRLGRMRAGLLKGSTYVS